MTKPSLARRHTWDETSLLGLYKLRPFEPKYCTPWASKSELNSIHKFDYISTFLIIYYNVVDLDLIGS